MFLQRAFLMLAAAIAAGAQAQTPAAAGAAPPKAAVCEACHGTNGNAVDPYPVLAGQTARYIYLQLKDFKEGRRADEQMTPVAKDLSPDEMQALASWFAAQKRAPQTFKADPQRVAIGRKKADEVLCAMCHLGGFSGQNEIPRVAAQNHDYVVKQLTDFKARRRTNDAGNMTSVANTLSGDDIENLAHYISTL